MAKMASYYRKVACLTDWVTADISGVAPESLGVCSRPPMVLFEEVSRSPNAKHPCLPPVSFCRSWFVLAIWRSVWGSQEPALLWCTLSLTTLPGPF